jgi:hypothetical protein
MDETSGVAMDFESSLTRLAAQLKIAEVELWRLARDLTKRVAGK